MPRLECESCWQTVQVRSNDVTELSREGRRLCREMRAQPDEMVEFHCPDCGERNVIHRSLLTTKKRTSGGTQTRKRRSKKARASKREASPWLVPGAVGLGGLAFVSMIGIGLFLLLSGAGNPA